MPHGRDADGFFQGDYTLGQIGVRLRADDAAVGRRMQMIGEYFGLEPARSTLPQRPLTLQWCAKGSRLAIPASATSVAAQQGLTVFQDAQRLYLSDGASIVQLDLEAGLARARVRATDACPVTAFRKDLLLYSLLFLLRYRDRYGLHGAGLARDGIGYLLVADSDCGKSTLALSLVRQGWSYLSDDSLLLYPQGDGIEARALRRDLCLDLEAARYFPDIVPHWAPCPLSDEVKQRLDMETCYTEQMIPTCIPRVLIFPEITTDVRSQLIPVGKAEAFAGILSQSLCVLFEPDRMPRHVDVITRLVRQATAYRLRAGRDLAREPSRITSLLTDLSRPVGAAST